MHSHGGVAIDHLRLFGLHLDLRPGDRFFWYTNTNWMMWNLVASALLAGATTVCFDGSPLYPGPRRLWEIAAETKVNVLGVSPGIFLAGMKAGLKPGEELDLSALRTIGATGAPVPAHCFPWVRDAVGERVQLASTSGGTDVVSGFAGSAPNLDVWAGELSAPLLGVALESWDDEGQPLIGEVGDVPAEDVAGALLPDHLETPVVPAPRIGEFGPAPLTDADDTGRFATTGTPLDESGDLDEG